MKLPFTEEKLTLYSEFEPQSQGGNYYRIGIRIIQSSSKKVLIYLNSAMVVVSPWAQFWMKS